MTDVGPSAWEDDNFDIRFAFFCRTDIGGAAAHPRGPSLPPPGAARPGAAAARATQHQMDRQIDRYARELQRHGVESVEREVRWLSDLIDAERGRDPSRAGAAPRRRARRRRHSPAASHRSTSNRPSTRAEGGTPWVRYE